MPADRVEPQPVVRDVQHDFSETPSRPVDPSDYQVASVAALMSTSTAGYTLPGLDLFGEAKAAAKEKSEKSGGLAVELALPDSPFSIQIYAPDYAGPNALPNARGDNSQPNAQPNIQGDNTLPNARPNIQWEDIQPDMREDGRADDTIRRYRTPGVEPKPGQHLGKPEKLDGIGGAARDLGAGPMNEIRSRQLREFLKNHLRTFGTGNFKL